MRSDRIRIFGLILIVAALSTAARVVLIWRGFAETSLIADDAYYYFTIARHIAQGLGPTFDGLAPTNGFHPFWQLLLVPVFALFPDDLWTPVRIALTLAVICDLGSGWLLLRLLLEATRWRLAVVATCAWFLLPATALLGLRGMESSLNTLLVLLLFYFLSTRRQQIAAVAPVTALQAGILFALCGLARTDNLLTVGSALTGTVLLMNSRATPKGRLTWLAWTGGTTLLVMAPWFLWNYLNFQSLIQVSGMVKLHARDLFGSLPWRWDNPVAVADSLGHLLFAPFLMPGIYLCGEEFEGGYWGRILFLFGLIATALVGGRALGIGWRQHRLRDTRILFPGIYLIGHGLLFGLVWRAYASWYAHTSYALLLFLMAVILRWQAAASRAWRVCAWTISCVILISQMAHYPLFATRLHHGPRGPEVHFGPHFDLLAARHTEEVVIGAFDAGALGYVAEKYPKVRVINLDGLVNNEAFAAARAGRYADYVISNVTYLVQDVARTSMYLEPDEVERLRRHFLRPH